MTRGRSGRCGWFVSHVIERGQGEAMQWAKGGDAVREGHFKKIYIYTLPLRGVEMRVEAKGGRRGRKVGVCRKWQRKTRLPPPPYLLRGREEKNCIVQRMQHVTDIKSNIAARVPRSKPHANTSGGRPNLETKTSRSMTRDVHTVLTAYLNPNSASLQSGVTRIFRFFGVIFKHLNI